MFEIYRGLKKPLLLFGLKDKYIYQAISLGASGALLAIVLSSFLGLMGLVIGLLLAAGSIAAVYKLQERFGLHRKTKNEKTLYVYPSRMRTSVRTRSLKTK